MSKNILSNYILKKKNTNTFINLIFDKKFEKSDQLMNLALFLLKIYKQTLKRIDYKCTFFFCIFRINVK